jgi:hypothetical protein
MSYINALVTNITCPQCLGPMNCKREVRPAKLIYPAEEILYVECINPECGMFERKFIAPRIQMEEL